VAVGDDPFNTDVAGFQKRGEKLVGEICGEVGEEVGGHELLYLQYGFRVTTEVLSQGPQEYPVQSRQPEPV